MAMYNFAEILKGYKKVEENNFSSLFVIAILRINLNLVTLMESCHFFF